MSLPIIQTDSINLLNQVVNFIERQLMVSVFLPTNKRKCHGKHVCYHLNYHFWHSGVVNLQSTIYRGNQNGSIQSLEHQLFTFNLFDLLSASCSSPLLHAFFLLIALQSSPHFHFWPVVLSAHLLQHTLTHLASGSVASFLIFFPLLLLLLLLLFLKNIFIRMQLSRQFLLFGSTFSNTIHFFLSSVYFV